MADRSVLLDTSILVDHLRGHAPATAALARLLDTDARVVASTLTRAEIRQGLPARQVAAWGALTTLIEWLPVGVAIADAAGELAARYSRSHGSVDLVDYLIAATAASCGAELWTRNVRHFPMLDGLASPY